MTLSEPVESRRDIAGSLTFAFGWVIVTIIAALLNPDRSGHGTHQHLGLPPCPSVVFFDRPCPGCGLTTAWTATVHGRLGEAFHAHALGPILYLGYTAYALLTFWFAYRKRRWIIEPWLRWTLILAGTIFLGYGIARFATTEDYAAPGERLKPFVPG